MEKNMTQVIEPPPISDPTILAAEHDVAEKRFLELEESLRQECEVSGDAWLAYITYFDCSWWLLEQLVNFRVARDMGYETLGDIPIDFQWTSFFEMAVRPDESIQLACRNSVDKFAAQSTPARRVFSLNHLIKEMEATLDRVRTHLLPVLAKADLPFHLHRGSPEWRKLHDSLEHLRSILDADHRASLMHEACLHSVLNPGDEGDFDS
jgi:hypothetical protein